MEPLRPAWACIRVGIPARKQVYTPARQERTRACKPAHRRAAQPQNRFGRLHSQPRGGHRAPRLTWTSSYRTPFFRIFHFRGCRNHPQAALYLHQVDFNGFRTFTTYSQKPYALLSLERGAKGLTPKRNDRQYTARRRHYIVTPSRTPGIPSIFPCPSINTQLFGGTFISHLQRYSKVPRTFTRMLGL
mgnify:CR=1 FL=1